MALKVIVWDMGNVGRRAVSVEHLPLTRTGGCPHG